MSEQEVEGLVLIGFLERSNESELGSPYFSQPKPKTNREHFLSDFINKNKN